MNHGKSGICHTWYDQAFPPSLMTRSKGITLLMKMTERSEHWREFHSIVDLLLKRLPLESHSLERSQITPQHVPTELSAKFSEFHLLLDSLLTMIDEWIYYSRNSKNTCMEQIPSMVYSRFTQMKRYMSHEVIQANYAKTGDG